MENNNNFGKHFLEGVILYVMALVVVGIICGAGCLILKLFEKYNQ